jgi:molybdopterin molybdotransferase
MKTQPGCDDFDPNALSVEQAIERIQQTVKPVEGSERLGLRSALNRVLAEDVTSPFDVPPHANSAMDGYAVRGADLPAEGEVKLAIIGTAWAGEPLNRSVETGQCARIMTGANVPAGADTIIMQEHVQVEGETIKVGTGNRQGQYVRHAGEDMARGQVILQQGTRLHAAELGLLASLGRAEVTVHRKLRVAIFSTGDELRGVGEVLEEGQIYDSNRYTFYGMLKRDDVELIDMGVIPDRREAVEQAFRQAARLADVVMTSGGVSVGDADYVKTTLDQLGEVGFWKIAMKPGRPLAFGRIGEAFFLGLPGNPVSVMATFHIFALPALRRMMGEPPAPPLTVKARTLKALKKRSGRTDFQRGVLSNQNGELVVDATGMQASHILSGMSRANCFIVLPAEWGDVEADTWVDVLPFHGLMAQ